MTIAAKNTALSVVEKYGKNIHLVAPATDRHTTPTALMVPFPTQIKIDANPDNGEVFKVGSRKDGNGWTDMLTLSKVSLERIAQAAGIIWDPRHTKPLTVEHNYLVYQAIGCVRMPDGSLTRISGTKEIDMEVIEEESRMLQARRLLKDTKADYEDLTEDQRKRVDRAVRAEMILFRKHRMARAETGAKNRAIRSLGLKSTYTPAELKDPYVVLRWGLNPTHDYAQAEMAALWGEQTSRLPENPLPQVEELEELGPVSLDKEEMDTLQAEPVDLTQEETDAKEAFDRLYAECAEMIEGLEEKERPGMTKALNNLKSPPELEDMKIYLKGRQQK